MTRYELGVGQAWYVSARTDASRPPGLLAAACGSAGLAVPVGPADPDHWSERPGGRPTDGQGAEVRRAHQSRGQQRGDHSRHLPRYRPRWGGHGDPGRELFLIEIAGDGPGLSGGDGNRTTPAKHASVLMNRSIFLRTAGAFHLAARGPPRGQRDVRAVAPREHQSSLRDVQQVISLGYEHNAGNIFDSLR